VHNEKYAVAAGALADAFDGLSKGHPNATCEGFKRAPRFLVFRKQMLSALPPKDGVIGLSACG
jgi:hypothetical protein